MLVNGLRVMLRVVCVQLVFRSRSSRRIIIECYSNVSCRANSDAAADAAAKNGGVWKAEKINVESKSSGNKANVAMHA